MARARRKGRVRPREEPRAPGDASRKQLMREIRDARQFPSRARPGARCHRANLCDGTIHLPGKQDHMDQKPLELILARNFLTSLSTPAFLVDRSGALIFYNEAAGAMLGISFE